MSAPVSVVIITRDEEHNIVRCLSSVQWAAERIVVDSGSLDRTVERARSLDAVVVQRPWTGYGSQKNVGIELASQPWILSLDADEEVTPALAAEISNAVSRDGREVAFRVYRPTFFMGSALGHYGRTRTEPGQVRLFRKDAGRFNERRVHETVQVRGPIGWVTAPLLHYSYPTLRSYWTKIHHYARLEADERAAQHVQRANRWMRATGKFVWMLFFRRGLFDGPAVWLWIAGQAYQEWLTTWS